LKRTGRIEGIITGLVLAAAFLRVSFEEKLPDHILVPITAIVLVGATIVIFLLLNRAYSGRSKGADNSSD
jgi:hypothetical protein